MGGIPKHIKLKLADLSRMNTCALAGKAFGSCAGHVEWHHAWHYAGGQINEVWAIVPACVRHHSMEKGTPEIDYAFKAYSLHYATEEDLEKYPKKDWDQARRRIRSYPHTSNVFSDI